MNTIKIAQAIEYFRTFGKLYHSKKQLSILGFFVLFCCLEDDFLLSNDFIPTLFVSIYFAKQTQQFERR